MKKTALFLLLATSVALAASTHRTNETLVGTSATALNQRSARGVIEIQNLGPNPIYCALGEAAQAVVGKARMIPASGGVWAVRTSGAIYCIASVAQVTGAATITTELELQ